MELSHVSALANGVPSFKPQLEHLQPLLWLVANGGVCDGKHGIAGEGTIGVDVAARALNRLLFAEDASLRSQVASMITAEHCFPLLVAGINHPTMPSVRKMSLRFLKEEIAREPGLGRAILSQSSSSSSSSDSSGVSSSLGDAIEKAVADDDTGVAHAATQLLFSLASTSTKAMDATIQIVSKRAADLGNAVVALRWFALAVQLCATDDSGFDACMTHRALDPLFSSISAANDDPLFLLSSIELLGDLVKVNRSVAALETRGVVAALAEYAKAGTPLEATGYPNSEYASLYAEQSLRSLAAMAFETKGKTPSFEVLAPIVLARRDAFPLELSAVQAMGLLCASSLSSLELLMGNQAHSHALSQWLRCTHHTSEDIKVAALEGLSAALVHGTASLDGAEIVAQLFTLPSMSTPAAAVDRIVKTASEHPSVHVRCAAYGTLATIASQQAPWAAESLLKKTAFLFDRTTESEMMGMEQRFCVAQKLSQNPAFRAIAPDDVLDAMKKHLAMGPYRGPDPKTRPPGVVDAVM